MRFHRSRAGCFLGKEVWQRHRLRVAGAMVRMQTKQVGGQAAGGSAPARQPRKERLGGHKGGARKHGCI